MQVRGEVQHVIGNPLPEQVLSERDPILAKVIAAQSVRWPAQPTEDSIWGLTRIVIAQQVSTHVACNIAERVKLSFLTITSPERDLIPSVAEFRAFGMPERRAQSCVDILTRADEIIAKVTAGHPWEVALAGIKGIGPWTISTFRVMVLRDPDVLPLGDVGLERAVANIYGETHKVEQLSEKWRPYRSVACWYLWKTLGNRQLG
jgi:DNA-3-methyladenine glycosylase II